MSERQLGVNLGRSASFQKRVAEKLPEYTDHADELPKTSITDTTMELEILTSTLGIGESGPRDRRVIHQNQERFHEFS